MNFADTQKPYLRNYDLMARLEGFFLKVGECADEYRFISATERRCFNFAYKLMPDPGREKLVSNCGLLLYHRQIAQEYVDSGRFPRILLLDDLMMHGRGLGKFLYQLEILLEEDLYGLVEEQELGDFRRRLVQAIDIRIFAKCKRPVLLEERYLERVMPYLQLSSKQMHDLSLQLSDALNRFEQANTSFVYSCQLNKRIWNAENSLWQQVDWEYQQEKMELYVRFYGKNRVSTIRTFGNRYANLDVPLMTSFTMLGNLSGQGLELCFQNILTILEGYADQFAWIRSVLRDTSPLVRRSKTQLLYLLCSAIDLQDFCQDIGIGGFETARDDVDKISRNFGTWQDCFQSMKTLLDAKVILSQIKEQVYPLLDCMTESLGFPLEKKNTQASVDAVNGCIREIFYEIGIESEKMAVLYTDTLYRFSPDAYQNYDGHVRDGGSDGILALRDFNQLADGYRELDDPYLRVAGFVAAMDCGIMGARVQTAMHKDIDFALCKAGEMATFYGPEQIAVALPAFELLERYSRKIDMAPLEAVNAFCDSLNEKDMRFYLSQEQFDRIHELRDEYPGLIEEIPGLAKKFGAMMYRGGHRFQDWNFENLTVRPNRGWMTYQWYLQKKAVIFLSLASM